MNPLKHIAVKKYLLAGAGVGTLMAGAAQAQVDEIVVTARKQEENLQSTPVTVSAFTEKGLKDRGIVNNIDLGRFTPNVVFDNSSTLSRWI